MHFFDGKAAVKAKAGEVESRTAIPKKDKEKSSSIDTRNVSNH